MAMMSTGLGTQCQAADMTMAAMTADEWHIKTQDDLDSIRAQLNEAKRVVKEHHQRFNAFLALWLTVNENVAENLDDLDKEYVALLRK